ncbi:6-pyruvoyl tetrahydropterin synthase [Marinobacter sp. es.042]|jgi:6-pyruvoyl-tetrahydropterin synthase|nr:MULTISPECIES: 6-carboxytetrahydropterin synthase [Marinobacter]MCR9189020.1 6-carboxytetrahydropterin synthase [Alteromonadaceae bacterium]PTB99474.1 6-pyruvoyl tetrahydropterin reductase [Marinobacter sp. Z-F4-2]MBW3225861.1 6-carboxytetrahydropterin synthase [Marinobacter adhaerens]SNB55113.1 6-pyruvoyl tetrahydropterin synthase [Marinobacter sp. es.042]HAZ87721.1 6-pyruvoyl tetrahydropterin reductase [Marinobacter adhaerens]
MNHLFVDNLTVIDFAYLDPTRGLVGESWIADVVLGGELDEQGMVFDFSNVKRTIKRVIDERVDHRLVIPRGYQGLSWSEEQPDTFTWALTDGSQIIHRSPDEAIVWLSADRVVPSAVASLLEQEIKAVLPANVISVEINLREEEIDGAYYHYVHGLKKHLGNCQRIAHGHRSPIRIDRNGHRDYDLERRWAKLWRDIYVGSEEDVVRRHVGEDGVRYVTFEYEANQGEFALTLPEERVYMLDTDTTVELIAAHMADKLKVEFATDTIRVKAYEGVGKGAIAER